VKRKLQVFISSTYEDLKEERQAAVEAILKAGHIPAGMELFTAGSESQLEVIKRWIEDSDVYVLILGGRYGSIEPKSGLSYSEVEFDYARSLNKPFFAVVITDAGLEERVKQRGTEVLEKTNEEKLRAFRRKVTSQMCALVDNSKDVKLAMFETLPQFATAAATGGWVAAGDVAPSEDVARQLTALLEENQKLRSDLERAGQQATTDVYEGAGFLQLSATLDSELITVPEEVLPVPRPDGKPLRVSVLQLAVIFVDNLARGIANSMNSEATESFLFYNVASRLASYGLAELTRVPSAALWQRIALSKQGTRFLTRARLNASKKASDQPETSRIPISADSTVDHTRPPRSTVRRKRVKK
jgi:hypothetical protein